MAKQDYARAILEFRNAANLNPKDPEPCYWLALAYLDSGDYRDGIASLLHTIELDSRHAGAQLKIAELTSGSAAEEFGGSVWDLAEKRLRTILAAWGSAAEASAGPGQAADLERLAANNPRDREAKSRLFQAYMVERRFPEAERLIEGVLEQIQTRQKRADRISLFKRIVKRFLFDDTEPAAGAQDREEEDPSAEQAANDADRQRQNLESADALVERAHLYLATARAREAEQDLLQALRLNPRDGLAHYLMSVVHQVHGSERARREELAQAVECDPTWLTARLELARSRSQAGDGFAALKLLDQAPKAQQSSLAYITERNRTLLAIDDRGALQKSLDQALGAAKNPSFLLQEGLLRLRMRDLPGARKYLEMALALNPEDLTALDARTESYMAGKQPELALSTLRAHVSRYPNSPGLQYLLGVWLTRLNRSSEATAAFQAAVHARPGFLPALEKLLDLEMAAGNQAAARQTISSIAAAPGGRAPAELALGILEEGPGGSAQAAIAHYRNVLNEDPDNVAALNNLAYHLAGDKSSAEEALSLALRVKQLDPTDPSVDDTIGWAYYNRGSYSLAVEHFEAAVARQRNAQREYHLAMAYLKAGNPSKARTTLSEALKMNDKIPEASLAMRLIDPPNSAAP